ncbi:MAG: hydroxyethylthiazole kinase [Bacteroidota bacterium]|nr:hydroxyethylthiazole kinase [Bacteroidota bacterium]
MINQKQIIQDLDKIREKAPLVHNITNYVVMNSTANALISIGASPVMAHAIEEMEDMVTLSSALVINIGTLSEKWIEAMHLAGKSAKNKGIPVVLDPVGAGATTYRTDATKSIIKEINPQIIRSNASELLAIANTGFVTKGVDSTVSSENALEAAKELAKNTGSVISISGKTDYVTNGKDINIINNGHPLMGKVTGTGCIATAITAAFASINYHFFSAATEAMIIMGIAGEMAAEEADAPGTFYIKFLDAFYKINGEQIRKHWKNG